MHSMVKHVQNGKVNNSASLQTMMKLSHVMMLPCKTRTVTVFSLKPLLHLMVVHSVRCTPADEPHATLLGELHVGSPPALHTDQPVTADEALDSNGTTIRFGSALFSICTPCQVMLIACTRLAGTTVAANVVTPMPDATGHNVHADGATTVRILDASVHYGAKVLAKRCRKYSTNDGDILVVLPTYCEPDGTCASVVQFARFASQGTQSAAATALIQQLERDELTMPAQLELVSVPRGSVRYVTTDASAVLDANVNARGGSRPNVAVPTQPPDQCFWHLVGVSSTITPAAKANRLKMPPEVQLSLVKQMIRDVPIKIHSVLDAHKPRPPADPYLKLQWSLYVSEKGKDGNAHIQGIDIFLSAYPQVQVTAAEKACARRAVGKTRWQRELQIRNVMEKPTVDVLSRLQSTLLTDRTLCNLNTKNNVFDMADAEEMKPYPSKDLDEVWFSQASLINDGTVSRSLRPNELQLLCDKQREQAARTLRSYKKVLDRKAIYLNDESIVMRVANHFEHSGFVHLMPALETGVNHLLAKCRAKLDPKRRLVASDACDLSMRQNACLQLELHPGLAELDPYLFCEAWYGDRNSVAKLQERTAATRARKHLPSLIELHELTEKELRDAIKRGTLNGQPLPPPPKQIQGHSVLVDHAVSSGNALDAQNMMRSEGHKLLTFLTNIVEAKMTGYAAAATALLLCKKGSEFRTLGQEEVDDVRHYAVREVLSSEWDDEELADMLRAPPPLSKVAIDEYLESNGSSFAPNAIFVGVLDFNEFNETFVDTINQAEPDDGDRTVRVCIIQSSATGHAFAAAWQVSRERNERLYAHEVEQQFRDEGFVHAEEVEQDE